VEGVAVQPDGGQLGVGGLAASGVGVGIELASHAQTGGGRGGGDQADDDRVADQRFAAPVLADEREQAVLDLG
jgi:hypothetical protein